MNTLELFNHVSLEYFEKSGKGMVRIDNADIIESNSGIERSFKKMCMASFFAEFVDRLTKEKERNDDLFNVLRNSLNSVKSVELRSSDVLYYQLQMLDHLGYMPNFKTCIQCGKHLAEHEQVCFSSVRGGTVCPQCSWSVPHRKYPEGSISSLADLKEVDAGNCTVFEQAGREILESFIAFHLNVDFKSYRLLRSVI
jgi:DNA repair protein RecO (recombination protein O)